MKQNYAYCFVLAFSVGCSTPSVVKDMTTTPFDASPVSAGSACAALAEVQAQYGPTKIALSWNGASDVGVTITRKTFCATDPYVLVATVPDGVSSYTDDSVQTNYVYWYKLSAVDSKGDTALTAIAVQARNPSMIGCEDDLGIEESGVNGLECSGGDGGS